MLNLKKLDLKTLDYITPEKVTTLATAYGSITNNSSVRIGDIIVLSFRFTANRTVPAYTSFITGLPKIKNMTGGTTLFSIWGRTVSGSNVGGMTGLSAYPEGTSISNWVQYASGTNVDIIGLYITE